MQVLNGLLLPLKVKDGNIIDASEKVIIQGEFNSLITPLSSTGRQAIIEVACYLLNESFQYDKIDQILNKLGYLPGEQQQD
jgi:hypothetical protein